MADDDIRTLVGLGDTIAAIRVHQARHGGTLTAARAAIEAMHWALTRERGAGGLERELDELVRRGDRIAAIKRYREATGCSLKEAADFIDAREAPAATAATPDDDEVDAMIRAGQKIQAIKRWRELHGGGLKEAKDAVEARAAVLASAPAPVPVDEIDAAIAAGQKILAMKRWREKHGGGLQAAKDAVEARTAALAASRPATADDVAGLQPEFDRLIAAGRFIPATEHYRRCTGAGLEGAIAAIDARRQILAKARGSRPAAAPAWDEVDRLILAGRKLDAIRRHRELTGATLRDARDAVEARVAALAGGP